MRSPLSKLARSGFADEKSKKIVRSLQLPTKNRLKQRLVTNIIRRNTNFIIKLSPSKKMNRIFQSGPRLFHDLQYALHYANIRKLHSLITVILKICRIYTYTAHFVKLFSCIASERKLSTTILRNLLGFHRSSLLCCAVRRADRAY